MPARQTDATRRNPNALTTTRVAVLERTIAANLERVWENVLDWEHLPHLHETSFGPVELIEGGDWGWFVYSSPDRRNTVELTVADDRSYVSRSYRDGEQNAEIWTFLSPDGPHTGIRVEFDLPNVPEARREELGDRMLALYSRLWDEDEAMMVERHQQLTTSRRRERSIDLGTVTELAGGHRFEVGGREYEVFLTDSGFSARPTVCPHLLGPLQAGDGEAELVCPWHGYRFDLTSGACVSPQHARCKLPPIPKLTEQDGHLIAALP